MPATRLAGWCGAATAAPWAHQRHTGAGVRRLGRYLLPRPTTRYTYPTDALREPPTPAQVGHTCRATRDRAPSADAGGPPPARPWLPPTVRGAALRPAPDATAWTEGAEAVSGAPGWRAPGTAGGTVTRQGHTATDPTGPPPRATLAAGEVCAVVRRQDAVRQPSCRARHTPVVHGMPPRGVPSPHGTDGPRRARLRASGARHPSPPRCGTRERHAPPEPAAGRRGHVPSTSGGGTVTFPAPRLPTRARRAEPNAGGEPPRHGRHPHATKRSLARSAPVLC